MTKTIISYQMISFQLFHGGAGACKDKASIRGRLANKHISYCMTRYKNNEKSLVLKRICYFEGPIFLNILSGILYLGNYTDIFLFFAGTLIFRSKHCQLHGN